MVSIKTYKPKKTNVEKLRVFLAKLNTQQNGK